MTTLRRLCAWWPLLGVALALVLLNFTPRPQHHSVYRVAGPNGSPPVSYQYGWPVPGLTIHPSPGPNQPRPWRLDRSAWLVNAVLASIALTTTALSVWLWPVSEQRLLIRHLFLLQLVVVICLVMLPPRWHDVQGLIDQVCHWVVFAAFPVALYVMVRVAFPYPGEAVPLAKDQQA